MEGPFEPSESSLSETSGELFKKLQQQSIFAAISEVAAQQPRDVAAQALTLRVLLGNKVDNRRNIAWVPCS